jgi:hypothetical protein
MSITSANTSIGRHIILRNNSFGKILMSFISDNGKPAHNFE